MSQKAKTLSINCHKSTDKPRGPLSILALAVLFSALHAFPCLLPQSLLHDGKRRLKRSSWATKFSLSHRPFRKVHNTGMASKLHDRAQKKKKKSLKGPNTRGFSTKRRGESGSSSCGAHLTITPWSASWMRSTNQKLSRKLVPLKSVTSYLSSCSTQLLQPEGQVPSYLPFPSLKTFMWRTVCIKPVLLRFPHTGRMEQAVRKGKKRGKASKDLLRHLSSRLWQKAALNLRGC